MCSCEDSLELYSRTLSLLISSCIWSAAIVLLGRYKFFKLELISFFAINVRLMALLEIFMCLAIRFSLMRFFAVRWLCLSNGFNSAIGRPCSSNSVLRFTMTVRLIFRFKSSSPSAPDSSILCFLLLIFIRCWKNAFFFFVYLTSSIFSLRSWSKASSFEFKSTL